MELNTSRKTMTDNPFLDEEEEKYIPKKPLQKETLTQKQHDRNIKGIRQCLDNLKKVKVRRVL